MSQPTSSAPGQGDSPVNVPFGAVLQKLHSQYGKLIEQLMQENAEATAGLESVLPELQYLRSVVAASQGAGGPVPATDGAVGPLGGSLIGAPLGGPLLTPPTHPAPAEGSLIAPPVPVADSPLEDERR